MAQKNALGRGLSALIEERGEEARDLIKMATSANELGIIQPLTVRKIGENKYQLITGERRLRAAVKAGLKKVPAYVREAEDENMLEMALVENIQREDLDAIEVAISYQRLMEEINLTQETLGERVGKKRATVTNYLRLLKLPADIQAAIMEKKLSMGQARALIGVEDAEVQMEAFKRTVDQDLSVRQVEAVVQKQQ
jgi:ParB family chromosome partitioning protein